MRFRNTQNDLTVTAICGTTCCLLSFHIDVKKTKGLLGFAIEREDKTENEKYFLKGFKYFEETRLTAGNEQLFTTFEQPIQSFLWEDFTVKAKHEYVYSIIPVFGKPKLLKYGKSCSITVNTPSHELAEHEVYFNRGVAGSNAYASKFKNKRPSEMAPDEKETALKWLSRGLFEALIGFINSAKDNQYQLRAALYEFEYRPVLEAFKTAFEDRNVDVQIVYDSRGQKEKNEESISLVNLPASILTPRTKNSNYISHNKFIILLKNNVPISVWTGSTNITEKGIFGQCNTGHIIKNENIAQKYFEYWKCLQSDPELTTIKNKAFEIQKELRFDEIPNGTSVFFSPRKSKDILKTYSDFINNSNSLICGMFPFSFNKLIKEAVTKQTDQLKYILIDKEDKNTTLVTDDFDNIIVYGGYFEEPLFDWLKEKSAGGLFKSGTNFIHNKIMLIDPMGENPIVVIGSANFSDNSISNNDENTLIIKGNKDLADMYLTEFVRVFNHYYVRQIAKKMTQTNNRNPLHLFTDSKDWVPTFYKLTTLKGKRKKLYDNMVV
ncbi:phospholipase D-like domain-containing protein [Flavobacterium sp.]|uniref:phospholipase D-like domain-containing protein n=1 Tax=Flavobacterium sp. TaxID=239 RepID=UPI00286A7F23|nr:phospholipase D-like domain-containing protein [Flavobacterium sp.]